MSTWFRADEFDRYVQINRRVEAYGITVVPESNDMMTGSYVMVDPAGRFFDNVAGSHTYSRSIIEVGVDEALKDVSVEPGKFLSRNGLIGKTQLPKPRRHACSRELRLGSQPPHRPASVRGSPRRLSLMPIPWRSGRVTRHFQFQIPVMPTAGKSKAASASILVTPSTMKTPCLGCESWSRVRGAVARTFFCPVGTRNFRLLALGSREGWDYFWGKAQLHRVVRVVVEHAVERYEQPGGFTVESIGGGELGAAFLLPLEHAAVAALLRHVWGDGASL